MDKHVNPRVVYALLFGACLHRVFLSHFLGQSFGPSDEMFVKDVVGAAFAGMRPAPNAPRGLGDSPPPAGSGAQHSDR